MSKNGSRRNFDGAFKVEAVRLVTEEKRKVAEVARELDIQANLLHRWKRSCLRTATVLFRGRVTKRLSRRSLVGCVGNWPMSRRNVIS